MAFPGRSIMLNKVGFTLAMTVCIVALYLALLILPITLATTGSRWLSPWLKGDYASMVIAAIIAGVPFGLAFGIVPARNVVGKAVAVSIVAAGLVVVFAAVFGGLRVHAWMPFLVEGVVFVAVFAGCAVSGHRLASRFARRPTAALGAIAFVALFGLLVVWPFFAAMPMTPMTDAARLDHALAQVRDARSDTEKFYALGDAAKQAFIAGQVDEARKYADELLRLAPQFERDWNYGNAIHNGNMVLGRIALREGRIDDAKQFLLKAGATPGSPQLDSFGPNVSLAKDLLEKGERDVVLQYFELVRKFWELENGRLDQWAGQVRAGKMPGFGPNLVY